MSDVRKQLATIVLRWYTAPGDNGIEGAGELADAIMERFDVVPKPAVTDEALGRLVADAHDSGRPYFMGQGQRMREALDAAGLWIVRVDDES